MAIYLITEQYIKENSPVTSNVNMKDLFPNITAAQTLFLQPILGSEFYEHIIQAFDNQTLTPDEVTLVQDYIKPGVLWRTLALSLPWLQFNLRAKGVLTSTDDFAFPTSTPDLKYIINEAANRAEFQEKLLNVYLCKEASLFPLYKTQSGLIEPQKKNNSGHGLIFY
jgi:hypothetical protein